MAKNIFYIFSIFSCALTLARLPLVFIVFAHIVAGIGKMKVLPAFPLQVWNKLAIRADGSKHQIFLPGIRALNSPGAFTGTRRFNGCHNSASE